MAPCRARRDRARYLHPDRPTQRSHPLDRALGAAHGELNAIKRLGVRVAVDDFGTGYSSLAYLRQFPVDTLKIDRAFVHGIASSKESAALIRTLIDLGN